MWDFVLDHKFIIVLVIIVFIIMLYIFSKQSSNKKKIVLKEEKSKNEAKQANTQIKETTQNNSQNVQVAEPDKTVSQIKKEEKNNLQKGELKLGEKQESLDNFKNERLKTHVMQLKPAVQAVILKK